MITEEFLKETLFELSKRRPVFCSEEDFQLELAWLIREKLPDVKVRLEYVPEFDNSMHIDILVITKDGGWIPIELKYKTRKVRIELGHEIFNLKEQSAQDLGRYLYLKDIMRVESVRSHSANFKVGYTIFITNESKYITCGGTRCNAKYREFAINDGAVKTGKLCWQAGSSALKKIEYETPIYLTGTYEIHWQNYSHIENSETTKIDNPKVGQFKFVINKIEGN